MIDPSNDSTLKKSLGGRWTLKGHDLNSGSCLEVNIDGQWIRIRIEHNKTDYYAIPAGVRLHQGLSARFVGKYTD